MKKHNVIDMTTYREELLRKTADLETPVVPPAADISDELKMAIEVLIDKLRAQDNAE